ncbi:MAG: peptidase M23 [Fusobacteria bacterium]|nr:MAG: peptidase M23 [Fusobacteriota bacterium]KAF0228097.1 MAG: peptidase [Fusobacteriota bacterium]
MSKIKIVSIVFLLFIFSLGIGFTGLNSNSIQADELKNKQVKLAEEIIKSIKFQKEIQNELETIKNKQQGNPDDLNIDLTLEKTFQKTLENLQIQLLKDKMEFQLVNQQLLSVGQTAALPYLGDGSYVWPVDGYFNVSQGYSGRHKGVDINTLGAHPSVFAVQTGIVTKAMDEGDGFGNKVVIYHGENKYTLYAHLDTIKAKVGQYIDEGTVLGTVGNTGNSDGDHLHIQLTFSGDVENNTINPWDYIKSAEKK